MRIIAGEARGRRLFAPEGSDTRPTADRVRESLFNILSSRVVDARVLDLFAGSGALALESISRGASYAVLNDKSRAAARVIERNVALMRAESRTRVLCRDWRAALDQLAGERFSLIFLDPPYRMADVYGQVAEALRTNDMLTSDALLIMEHTAQITLALPAEFEIADERAYRDIRIALVRQKEEPHACNLPGQL